MVWNQASVTLTNYALSETKKLSVFQLIIALYFHSRMTLKVPTIYFRSIFLIHFPHNYQLSIAENASIYAKVSLFCI